MYTLHFADPIAGQSFDRLPRLVQRRFNQAFEFLVQHPRSLSPELDVHQLSGYQNLWTLRISPGRGVYAIAADDVVLIVFGHQTSVYPLLHGLLLPEGRCVAWPPKRRNAVRTQDTQRGTL
ncbi:MAG: hypothetical protein WA688_09510 [Thermoplasmata archaeon]